MLQRGSLPPLVQSAGVQSAGARGQPHQRQKRLAAAVSLPWHAFTCVPTARGPSRTHPRKVEKDKKNTRGACRGLASSRAKARPKAPPHPPGGCFASAGGFTTAPWRHEVPFGASPQSASPCNSIQHLYIKRVHAKFKRPDSVIRQLKKRESSPKSKLRSHAGRLLLPQ